MVTVEPATTNVPVLAAPVFVCTAYVSDDAAVAATVIHDVLDVPVHGQPVCVLTATVPDPPSYGKCCDVGATANEHSGAAGSGDEQVMHRRPHPAEAAATTTRRLSKSPRIPGLMRS